MNQLWSALALGALSCAPALLRAQTTLALRGGTVIPVAGPRIESGTVLIRNGKIAAIGRDLVIPSDARVIDTTGKYVMPGLIDAMSYYGIAAEDLNETVDPVTPRLRVIEAYYPFGEFGMGLAENPGARDLLGGGVTTHYIAPGDATVIGGQGAVVKAMGASFSDLVLREPAAIDMTLGARPATTFRDRNRSPGTRMAVVSRLREALVRAQEYERRQRDHAALPEAQRRTTAPPARDLDQEALGRLLRRELPARVQANRTAEIEAALRLAQEFNFDLIIDSGAEADAMAARLAARGVPVVIGPISHPFVSGEEIPDREEYGKVSERRAARLAQAGVKFAIASFSRSFGRLGAAGSGRWLLLDAALAAGFGLSEEQVLRAITLTPAEILGVAQRVGSLEPGKDADVIILSGPPLSVKTWVERVFIDGREVHVRQ